MGLDAVTAKLFNRAWIYGSLNTGEFEDSFGNRNCAIGGMGCGDDFSLWLRNSEMSYWFCAEHEPKKSVHYVKLLNVKQSKEFRKVSRDVWNQSRSYSKQEPAAQQQPKTGGNMSVLFFKDGDRMGIETDCATEVEFVQAFTYSLAAMIDEKKLYAGDWEFQLSEWLPQFVDIVCSYRGYKAPVRKSVVIASGDCSSLVFNVTPNMNNSPKLMGFMDHVNGEAHEPSK